MISPTLKKANFGPNSFVKTNETITNKINMVKEKNPFANEENQTDDEANNFTNKENISDIYEHLRYSLN